MRNPLQLTDRLSASPIGRTGFLTLTLAIALLASLAGVGSVAVSQTTPNNRVKQDRTLVAAVSGKGDGELNVDAVVIVEQGKLLPPYDEDKEDVQTRFGNEYFKAGRSYRLTFGGGDAGTATIKRWDKGCNNIHATAEAKTTAKLTDKIKGLITNSRTLGTKPSARRALTPAERENVMKLVKQLYVARGATPALLRRMTTTNLTATDLDGDGKFEVIGSFAIVNEKKFRRDLFLIAQP